MELRDIENFMDTVYEQAIKLNDVDLYKMTRKHYEDMGYVFTFIDHHQAFKKAN